VSGLRPCRLALVYVADNVKRFSASFDAYPDGSGLAEVVADFSSQHPEVSAERLTDALRFIYYLHHLR
jgi:hypothetical protein